MNKFVLALLSAVVVFAAGCASSGSSMAGGGLPEIAPYDEAAVAPLPTMVPAHQLK